MFWYLSGFTSNDQLPDPTYLTQSAIITISVKSVTNKHWVFLIAKSLIFGFSLTETLTCTFITLAQSYLCVSPFLRIVLPFVMNIIHRKHVFIYTVCYCCVIELV